MKCKFIFISGLFSLWVSVSQVLDGKGFGMFARFGFFGRYGFYFSYFDGIQDSVLVALRCLCLYLCSFGLVSSRFEGKRRERKKLLLA